MQQGKNKISHQTSPHTPHLSRPFHDKIVVLSCWLNEKNKNKIKKLKIKEKSENFK